MEEQEDKCLALCMDFTEQLQENNFLDVTLVVMKHDVINMILKLNATPWSGDVRML
jgi:hypothetical protein